MILEGTQNCYTSTHLVFEMMVSSIIHCLNVHVFYCSSYMLICVNEKKEESVCMQACMHILHRSLQRQMRETVGAKRGEK